MTVCSPESSQHISSSPVPRAIRSLNGGSYYYLPLNEAGFACVRFDCEDVDDVGVEEKSGIMHRGGARRVTASSSHMPPQRRRVHVMGVASMTT